MPVVGNRKLVAATIIFSYLKGEKIKFGNRYWSHTKWRFSNMAGKIIAFYGKKQCARIFLTQKTWAKS
jgi:hypothetical protein